LNACRIGKSFDNGQKGKRGESRSFICLGVDDFLLGVHVSPSAIILGKNTTLRFALKRTNMQR
ncbi:MAG: hypothetical protein VX122_09270, partial [Pseudomonadota bacterium]|nr:hypothetical protein [Pseudomonadota bacterium]